MEMQTTARPLADLEDVIERGLATFVEVGQALLEIREARLYRETHGTFEDYCRERWGFNRSRASQLIQAAEVSRILDTPPTRASHAEELARLPEPEAVREVWAEVKEEKGDRVTAADVRAAVDRRLGIERPAFTCSSCGEEQAEAVWHCDGCGGHWLLRQACGDCPPIQAEPEYGYDEPIADSEGVEHVTYPMAMPSPEPQTDEQEPISLPSTQAMRDAYLRADFLKCVTKVSQIVAYAPDRVVAVLPPDDADAAERTLTRLVDWLAQFKGGRVRPMRVIGE